MASRRCNIICAFLIVKLVVLYLVLHPAMIDPSSGGRTEDDAAATTAAAPRVTTSATPKITMRNGVADGVVASRSTTPPPAPSEELLTSGDAVSVNRSSICHEIHSVDLITRLGTITFELLVHDAPKTALNFIRLVQSGFYNGSNFYRYEPNFVLQGGGWPTKGSPFKPVPLEYKVPNAPFHVSMARTSDPNSATTEFSIMLVDNSKWLGPGGSDPYGYTVFAKVVAGKEVIAQFAALKLRKAQLTLLDPAVSIDGATYSLRHPSRC